MSVKHQEKCSRYQQFKNIEEKELNTKSLNYLKKMEDKSILERKAEELSTIKERSSSYSRRLSEIRDKLSKDEERLMKSSLNLLSSLKDKEKKVEKRRGCNLTMISQTAKRSNDLTDKNYDRAKEIEENMAKRINIRPYQLSKQDLLKYDVGDIVKRNRARESKVIQNKLNISDEIKAKCDEVLEKHK